MGLALEHACKTLYNKNRNYSVVLALKHACRTLYNKKEIMQWSLPQMTFSYILIIIDGSFRHQPKKVPGSAKYAGFRPGVGKGMYSARSFPGIQALCPRLKQALIQAANNSLAESTWSQVIIFLNIACLITFEI